MKLISHNTQEGSFIARKTFCGEVGIAITQKTEKGEKLKNPIYWNNPISAINDLQVVIEYFKSKEDE